MSRILIVEDDPDLAKTMRGALEDAGFEVESVLDGLAAVQWLAWHRPPDLAIVDLMMPQLSGWELLAELRYDRRFAETSFVVATALEVAGEPSLPADAFLRKPFQLDEMLQVVERTLRRRAPLHLS